MSSANANMDLCSQFSWTVRRTLSIDKLKRIPLSGQASLLHTALELYRRGWDLISEDTSGRPLVDTAYQRDNVLVHPTCN
ncbi:hypothetical protein TNCV_1429091 [Trichonephila clavipes]|nr:hypothetical protein TNCV_1429091 [Trichonephila clavipes]